MYCKHRAASARLWEGSGTAAAFLCATDFGFRWKPPPSNSLCRLPGCRGFAEVLLGALGSLWNKLNVSIFHIRRIVSNYGKSFTEFRNTCRVFKAGFGSYAFISNPSLLTHE